MIGLAPAERLLGPQRSSGVRYGVTRTSTWQLGPARNQITRTRTNTSVALSVDEWRECAFFSSFFFFFFFFFLSLFLFLVLFSVLVLRSCCYCCCWVVSFGVSGEMRIPMKKGGRKANLERNASISSSSGFALGLQELDRPPMTSLNLRPSLPPKDRGSGSELAIGCRQDK